MNKVHGSGCYDWDSGTSINIASRTMKLPEHIGSENTDNCISELMAVCMAEEFLPPGRNAIYLADAIASIATYRSIRDGTVETEKKFIRRTLT